MTYISFNPLYTLKPDEGRTLILARYVGRNLLDGTEDSLTNAIHPIYAMILSFVDGNDKDTCISRAAENLGVEKELVTKFINSLIDNPNQVFLKSNDGTSAFPPHTIVSSEYAMHEHRYTPNQFEYEKADVTMKRHITPSTLTLMVNNVCVTDCIYCYQDKSRLVNCTIPLQRIIEIIQEAKALYVNSFDVVGGEFFLYKHWREVLAELRKYDFNPYLSTKMPLTKDMVKTLAELKIRDIQVSLDSLIEEHLISSIGVTKGYAERMIESLRLLDRYHIPVMIHSVLTKHNHTIEDMQSVYDELSKLSNIIDWHIVKGDDILYPRCPYSEIEIADNDLSTVSAYLNQLDKSTPFSIRAPQGSAKPTGQIETEEQSSKSATHEDAINSFFSDRTFCSGLFSSLYILPDGKVTICEQLYWNPTFIVGNLKTQSISGVWNSDKAKALYYIQPSDIPEDSLCHACTRFADCRHLRQVCYREIIKKYGNDHWYYPDVNCPFAKSLAK